MKVLKFGGTSVASPENILKVVEIVKNKSRNSQLIIVASAMGGVTNLLVKSGELAGKGNEKYKSILSEIEQKHFSAIDQLFSYEKQSDIKVQIKQVLNELDDICNGIFLLREIFPKTKDFLMSFGERLSALIISESFNVNLIPTKLIDARDLIITDENFGNANVNFDLTNKNVQQRLKNVKENIFVSGFIASSMSRKLTTLGRGGSDYTASILASAVDAEMLEIWTDVDGVMTADPNIVSSAYLLEKLSYEEAMELSHFGAKVIYSPTINPVLWKGIPVLIKNTFKPDTKGTLICKEGSKNGKPVKGLSRINKISLLTLTGGGMVGVTGVAARLFTALSLSKVNVIFITQASSEHTITIGIDIDEEGIAREAITREFENEIELGKIKALQVEHDLSIVALVGDNMKESVGLSGKSFSSLGKNGINVRAIAQGSTERNISIVINRKDVHKALNVLHERFFLSKLKKVHLFLIGVGNVGETLISQIQEQYEYLKKEHKLEIKIVALANSRKMLFNQNAINLTNWKKTLIEEGEVMDRFKFIEIMQQMNIRNSVFVDNTADETIAGLYHQVLDKSISVVASNKIAASSEYANYLNLNMLAKQKNVKFLFETNVGAGLPILKTINDMVKSGDKISKIQAVLSGSLNFIFNNFIKGVSFSDVVKQAMEEGYTEPDPRIDLSGMDVARKILILARESGYEMEMSEINNSSFMPKELMEKDTVKEFLTALKDYDAYFEKMRHEAENDDTKLRYVAEFDKGNANVGLKKADSSKAYYQLDGKDNIVLLYTNRYKEQPLVVKGAGAGADVTASGVFADIISIANQ
ncbi:MAG: bifunctional aspartate kinase/homoserine dehydrogenase I [Bacteroidetes bacterium]|nr:MAG: bifunctional aspartate kinase/homoserine dehydrogenase I [Bacteroidota bacterium]